MARMDIGTIILYGGGVIVGYYVLKSWGIITEPCDPTICTAECPKGPKYSRGLFSDCAPNYVNCDFNTNCCCLSAASLSSNNVNNWEPLSKDEINNLKIEEMKRTSPADIYKDDRFDVRTGRGRMKRYGFAGTE